MFVFNTLVDFLMEKRLCRICTVFHYGGRPVSPCILVTYSSLCSIGFGLQVYISKDGQELTGRVAYRQYQRVICSFLYD